MRFWSFFPSFFVILVFVFNVHASGWLRVSELKDSDEKRVFVCMSKQKLESGDSLYIAKKLSEYLEDHVLNSVATSIPQDRIKAKYPTVFCTYDITDNLLSQNWLFKNFIAESKKNTCLCDLLEKCYENFLQETCEKVKKDEFLVANGLWRIFKTEGVIVAVVIGKKREAKLIENLKKVGYSCRGQWYYPPDFGSPCIFRLQKIVK